MGSVSIGLRATPAADGSGDLTSIAPSAPVPAVKPHPAAAAAALDKESLRDRRFAPAHVNAFTAAAAAAAATAATAATAAVAGGRRSRRSSGDSGRANNTHQHHHQQHHSPISPSSSSKPKHSSGGAATAAATGAAATTTTITATTNATSSNSSSTAETESSRAKLADHKDRRLAKLRHRAKTMEPPVLSFYGAQPVPLPSRFASIKRRLLAGHEAEIQASWGRLIAALAVETADIAALGSSLIPSIDFDSIDDSDAVAPFRASLQRFGVGVVRGVVPEADAEAWVAETQTYLESKHDIKPPSPQDPTCFDFFWTPAQIRARAHPHVLRAMRFAMGFWDGAGEDDDRMATRFPISYADRLRIHVTNNNNNNNNNNNGSGSGSSNTTTAAGTTSSSNDQGTTTTNSSSSPTTTAAAAAAAAVASASSSSSSSSSGPIIAQVDGGSLERWEPDGYGRGGTYDPIFRGDWEAYDPWHPSGRVNATPDLYNGAGACSIFRMFQGLLALTAVKPGMVRLLPSPKLVTAYFLLRPFFVPKTPAPPPETRDEGGPEWDAFLAADNWELQTDPTTILHGAVPGHAQRVTELWHPHLQLHRSLVTPPNLQAGDYIIWHCDTAYVITSSSSSSGSSGMTPDSSPNSRPATPPNNNNTISSGGGGGATAPSEGSRPAPLMVYAPACPLTQTNALYLARQRKAFLRGHPGPDFDSTGTGLNSEATHVARLGEAEINEVGGEEGLRAMGLAPWDVHVGATTAASGSVVKDKDQMDIDSGEAKVEEGEEGGKASGGGGGGGATGVVSQAEAELVRLANIILFPDKYEFYMATRNSTPEGARG